MRVHTQPPLPQDIPEIKKKLGKYPIKYFRIFHYADTIIQDYSLPVTFFQYNIIVGLHMRMDIGGIINMQNIRTDVGQFIKDAILYHGITQRELAHRLHMTPQTLNGYLNGRTTLKIDDFCRIAKILDINPNEALGFEKPCGNPYESEISAMIKSLTREQKLKIVRFILQ